MSEPKMHYEGCWMGRVHHDCTVRMVQYLQSGLAQAREELVTADAAMDAVQALWRSPAEAKRQDANLAQARNELSQRLVERISDVHIIREAGGKLDRARAELLQARAELKDLHETDHKFGRLTILRNRDYWYDKAVAAECECDEWRKKAQVHLATLDAAEAALGQMRETLQAERAQRQVAETGERAAREMLSQAIVAQADAELAAHVHDKACCELAQTARTEQALRRDAEQYVNRLRQKLEGVHDALDECDISRNYDNGAQASVRTRIFWLNQRATRAEALAQLVNAETAKLLEKLAGHAWYAYAQRATGKNAAYDNREAARKLAAQIREALDDSQA